MMVFKTIGNPFNQTSIGVAITVATAITIAMVTAPAQKFGTIISTVAIEYCEDVQRQRFVLIYEWVEKSYVHNGVFISD